METTRGNVFQRRTQIRDIHKILEKEGITHFRKPIQREQLDSLIKKVLNEANGK